MRYKLAAFAATGRGSGYEDYKLCGGLKLLWYKGFLLSFQTVFIADTLCLQDEVYCHLKAIFFAEWLVKYINQTLKTCVKTVQTRGPYTVILQNHGFPSLLSCRGAVQLNGDPKAQTLWASGLWIGIVLSMDLGNADMKEINISHAPHFHLHHVSTGGVAPAACERSSSSLCLHRMWSGAVLSLGHLCSFDCGYIFNRRLKSAFTAIHACVAPARRELFHSMCGLLDCVK